MNNNLDQVFRALLEVFSYKDLTYKNMVCDLSISIYLNIFGRLLYSSLFVVFFFFVFFSTSLIYNGHQHEPVGHGCLAFIQFLLCALSAIFSGC